MALTSVLTPQMVGPRLTPLRSVAALVPRYARIWSVSPACERLGFIKRRNYRDELNVCVNSELNKHKGMYIMSKNRNLKVVVSPLNVSLIHNFEPLVAKIDEGWNFAKERGADSGQQQPSTQDIGIRVVLGMATQNWYNQVYGPIITKRGSVQSAKERMDYCQHVLDEHAAKFNMDMDAMATDPRTGVLVHNLEVAEERYNCYKNMLEAHQEVYESITGEKWKSMNEGTTQPGVKKVEASQEEKDAYLAKLAKLTARKTA